jgi:LacI family transcriptional regulator
MREIPKVALLVETARGFGRDLLQGIARYSRLHGPWSFHITPGDYKQAIPKIKQWGGTGIIARIPDARSASEILKAGVPTIALGLTDEQMSRGNPLSKVSEISSDPVEVSRLAAEHLLERGLVNFAYVGSEDRSWSARRERTYYNFLSKRGLNPHVYRQPKRAQDRMWEREQATLAEWIRGLPTPIGLFACDDDRGREVLEACTIAGLRVPDEVAVVGVDNDEVFCDLADPPLSSVALNVEKAGYRAAELLDGMMRGRIRKSRKIVVEALAVVNRRSTDMVAIDDENIMAALQHIRRSNGKDLSVASVVQQASLSRRMLEKRFRETVGRTILEDIHHVRLERCKQMLLRTPYPVSEIARLGGFATTGYFIQFFLKRVGTTPRKYRIDQAG